MLDLRDRVADAIARTHVATTAAVHPLMEDYRPDADAALTVMRHHQDGLDRETDAHIAGQDAEIRHLVNQLQKHRAYTEGPEKETDDV